jgi:serine/threonine protein phosphatase PrpC
LLPPGDAGFEDELAELDHLLEELRLGGRAPPSAGPEESAIPVQDSGPPADVYHLCLRAYSCLAGLPPAGFPGAGPAAFDFDFPPLRVYRPHLPPGIAPVLARGLRRDPASGFATPADLLSALEDAVGQARRRKVAAVGALGYDLGGLTSAGRAKSARGLSNEDALWTRAAGPGTEPFVVVADGVTHCRVGSGALASRIVCEELAALLPRLFAQAQTRHQRGSALESACVAASQAVVRQALALGRLPPDVEPRDLMSSTVLIGAVHEGGLSLACVGDCRAYLIAESGAEQLTVDGDLACVELAAGTPPEVVRAAGSQTRALYSCLGVCKTVSGRGFCCDVERSLPQVTHWRLLPGDVLLFCSDGLIEEGVFLEPPEVAALVSQLAHLPAQTIAERLVAVADERQRLPSPDEPQGHGDNITCVVLKVSAEAAGS